MTQLAAGVERIRDTLIAHLGREEEEIVPVAGAVLTQSEWDAMGEHARTGIQQSKGSMPKDVMAIQLGLMLATVPADERPEWIKENLPAPIWLLYSLLLKRRYERRWTSCTTEPRFHRSRDGGRPTLGAWSGTSHCCGASTSAASP